MGDGEKTLSSSTSIPKYAWSFGVPPSPPRRDSWHAKNLMTLSI